MLIQRSLSVISVILLSLATTSWAQGPLPGAILTGQVERQYQETHKARSKAPQLKAPIKGQPMPAGAESVRFHLNKVIIDGSTVYPDAVLAADLEPLLQREVSLADLYRLAEKLTARYRTDGYLLSQVIIPEQAIENGVVRLQVIEGFINAIRLVGVQNDRRAQVAAHAEKIRSLRPLNVRMLERHMLLINDLPGAFARAVLSPSPDTFGAADLTIQFSQRRFSGGLSLNNRGGKAMGPVRLVADIEGNNLLGLQDRNQARFVASPDNELKYFSLLHEQPVGSEGGKVSLLATHVNAIPEEMAFIPLNLETRSTGLSITYSQPLLRSRSENLYLRSSLISHDGETSIFGVTDTEDHLRALRLGLEYDLADGWDGINLLDIEFSQGLDGLGASQNGDWMLSRPNGKVDFRKLTLYAAREQRLSDRWSLLAALSSQYAFDDLLVSELFSYGGEALGRAYNPSELVGDHGLAMKLELRYSDSLDIGMPLPYTLYGYYDAGKVWQRSDGGLPGSDFDSASARGIGLRFSAGKRLSGFVELAEPIDHDVAAEGNRNHRIFAGLSARF